MDGERKVREVPKEKCSQAVIDWFMIGKDKNHRSEIPKSDLRKKSMKHLSAVGWTFFYNDRRMLRYVSPSGRCHFSLRAACETCIAERSAVPGDSATADSGRLFTEKVSRFSRESSPGTNAAGKSPAESSNSNANSPASPPSNQRRKRNDDPDYVEGQNFGRSSQNSKRLRKCSAGKERVRKVPQIRGFSSQSSEHSKASVLALLIDNNVVESGAKVSYRGKQSTSGEITREGIKCHCCSLVFALTAFESHVGSTNHRPAAFIVLEDGRTLADCKRQMNSGGDRTTRAHKEESDEICSVCQYGGELLLCDRCPSAYHLNCLGYQTAPEGDWFCASCRCGVCGHGKMEEEAEDNGLSNNSDIAICHQCERKFHTGCLIKSGVNSDDQTVFCSKKCETITLGLRSLVGKPIQVGSDSSLTWTLLKSKENDPKLSAALSVMHECFEPVKDPLTQRDMVEDVIFGRKSEVSRLNFKGFYVVVLERENEVMSVATVRIYGEKLAEMPLVATGLNYRRLGMCRVLLDELQNQLINLGVERLTLPSASVVLRTWVDSFGFSEMSVADKLEFLCYNLLDFQGTIMCQKLLAAKGNDSSPVVQDLPSEEDKDTSVINDHCFSESGISVITVEKFEDVEISVI